ncbi:MAG: DUF3575 domain-containing protein [Firmicutes bacterium]|nr:DUF3575 domain-containing protein [Bacillota bacterium]
MRKIFLLVLITIALLAVTMVPAQAAEAIVSTDILGDIGGIFNGQYEMAMGNNLSLVAGVGFGIYSILGYTVSSTMIQAGANYYLSKVLEGLYVGGELDLVIVNAEDVSGMGFGAMAVVGYKLNVGESFVIDPYAGIGLGGFGIGVKLGYAIK